jgi:hypothetical protein
MASRGCDLNTLYRNVVGERVRFALASAQKVSTLEHSGVKGAIREVLIADLFRPLLPSDLGIATGVIISADDRQSAQQDIVIFDRSILPPVLFESGPALIPVESVIATVEVKSCLTASELKNAHANAISIRDLTMQAGSPNETESSAAINTLFALTSDLSLTGKTETQRYEDILNDEPPPLRAICVAGKGSWFPQVDVLFDKEARKYRTRDGNPFQHAWREVLGGDEHPEILEMLTAFHSQFFKIASGRGRPSLYHYLL